MRKFWAISVDYIRALVVNHKYCLINSIQWQQPNVSNVPPCYVQGSYLWGSRFQLSWYVRYSVALVCVRKSVLEVFVWLPRHHKRVFTPFHVGWHLAVPYVLASCFTHLSLFLDELFLTFSAGARHKLSPVFLMAQKWLAKIQRKIKRIDHCVDHLPGIVTTV